MNKAPKAKFVSEADHTQACDSTDVTVLLSSVETSSQSREASFKVKSDWEANEYTAKSLQIESKDGKSVEISVQNLGGLMKKAAEHGCEIAMVEEGTDADMEEDGPWDVGVGSSPQYAEEDENP